MDVFVLIVLAGLGVHEFFRRLPVQISLAVFGVLPILLTIPWVRYQEQHDWITWIKIYTVLFALNLFNFARWRYKSKNKFVFNLIYITIIVNILLPISRIYFINNKILAAMMGISALFLVLTLPNARSIEIAKDRYRDFYWDLPYSWILAYTVWDWCVVYLLFPPLSGNQTAMLLAPVLVAIKNRKLYAQARAYSFSFYLLMGFTVPSIQNLLLTPDWNNILIQWVSTTAAFICTLVWFLRSYKLFAHR